MFKHLLVVLCVISAEAFLGPTFSLHQVQRQKSGSSLSMVVKFSERRAFTETMPDLSLAPVSTITTTDQFFAALAANPHRLVCVKFFAEHCRACRNMDIKYRRMALDTPDVVFLSIDIDEGREIKEMFDIKAVPTVMLYAGPLGQVAAFPCGPRKMDKLTSLVGTYKEVARTARRASGGLIELVETPAAQKMSMSSQSLEEEADADRNHRSVGRGIMEKLQDLQAPSLKSLASMI